MNNYINDNKDKLSVGVLVVIIVLVAGGVWYAQKNNKSILSGGLRGTEQLLSSKYTVKDATAESFGDLSKVSIVPATQSASLKSAAPVAPAGLGGASGMGGAPENVATDKMIAPGEPYPVATQYTFKYDGGELPELAESQGVLKRAKPQQPAGIVSKVISFLSFGLVDLTKLTNPILSSVMFTEDKPEGYQASVDLEQGNVYFYKNWAKWPNDAYNCIEVACITPKPMKIEDLPSDADMIAAADQFITDYGISKEGYGAPIVNNQWRVQYENASPAERINWYIPEQLQITYPLLIDGKSILDESGYVYGMSVFVDAKSKKVTSTSDLVTKQFERSYYTGVTDSDKIMDVVKKGGFRNASYEDPGARKVQLKLDTPTIQTVKMWYSNDNYKNNSELYVPTLVFPIKNWKETNYWRQNIFVPLVQDILNSDDQQPIPIIMPMGGAGADATSPKTQTTNN